MQLRLMACFLLTVTSGQTLLTAPVNTTAKVNSQAFFNCTAEHPDNDSITWDYNKRGSSFPVRIYTSNNGEVKKDLQNYFSVERDDTNKVHNLVIKNVTLELGVRYFCGFTQEGIKGSAELIAVSTLCNFMVSLEDPYHRIAPNNIMQMHRIFNAEVFSCYFILQLNFTNLRVIWYPCAEFLFFQTAQSSWNLCL